MNLTGTTHIDYVDFVEALSALTSSAGEVASETSSISKRDGKHTTPPPEPSTSGRHRRHHPSSTSASMIVPEPSRKAASGGRPSGLPPRPRSAGRSRESSKEEGSPISLSHSFSIGYDREEAKPLPRSQRGTEAWRVHAAEKRKDREGASIPQSGDPFSWDKTLRR